MAIGAPKELSKLRRFFLEPRLPKHRQYEALRAYLVEGRLAKDVARAFGYTLNSFHVLCHHFRRETHPAFFLSPRHGPQSQPKKSAARDLIVKLAAQNRLPAVYPLRLFVTAGGLISYGPDIVDQYRRAAGYVDRILKGEKPADLPIEQPTAVALKINLKTAKALGLALPSTLVARADEVIE